MKKPRWKIRALVEKVRGTVVHEYDIIVMLPDGIPHRERRYIPEFDDEGRRIATRREREQFVADRFALLRTYGKEDPDEIKKRIEAKALTTAVYLEGWLSRREARQIPSVRDDRTRLRTHAIPLIGKIPLVDLRPHHVRDLLRALQQKPSRRGGKLAPRTIRHVYFLLRQALHDAVADETIAVNPAMVSKSEVPQKRDKTPGWRSGAVFTRDEVEQLISDERIPEDRRVAYAIEFLTGARTGEVSALCWRRYEPNLEPLGRLTIEVAYNTRSHLVKETKTERARQAPVHPTLAKVLASWKLSGWRRFFGRAPAPGDLIVPARGGGHRNVAWALSTFHQDLQTLGLRERRHYDSRRTFISLGLGDGASKDLLRWVTHAPGDVFDAYTSPPWSSLCREVAKLEVGLREGGKVIPIGVEKRGDGVETAAAPSGV